MCPGSRSERWSTSRVIRTSPLTFVSKTVRSSSSVDSVERRPAEREPGGVDEDVGRPGGVDEALAARRVGDVELERNVGLEPLDPPRPADHARTLARRRPRGRGADAARGSGHDRRLPVRAAAGERYAAPTARAGAVIVLRSTCGRACRSRVALIV